MTLTSKFLKAIVFCTSAIVGVDEDRPSDEAGSAFSIDATSAAKLFAVVYVLQGLFIRCFPVTQARWYGCGESNAINYAMTYLGSFILFTGIGASCMLILDYSVCVSIGAVHAGNVISQGLLVFNPKFQQFRNSAFYAIWASTLVGAYAGLSEAVWCTTFFRVFATFHALVALTIVLFPSAENVAKSLNFPLDSCRDGNFLSLAKGTGLFYLCLEAFVLMALYGEDAALALGCSSLFGLLHFFDFLFVSKTARKQTVSCLHYMFWLVFFSVLIPLCLGFAETSSAPMESQTQPMHTD
jgi:hypothetical protein